MIWFINATTGKPIDIYVKRHTPCQVEHLMRVWLLPDYEDVSRSWHGLSSKIISCEIYRGEAKAIYKTALPLAPPTWALFSTIYISHSGAIFLHLPTDNRLKYKAELLKLRWSISSLLRYDCDLLNFGVLKFDDQGRMIPLQILHQLTTIHRSLTSRLRTAAINVNIRNNAVNWSFYVTFNTLNTKMLGVFNSHALFDWIFIAICR